MQSTNLCRLFTRVKRAIAWNFINCWSFLISFIALVGERAPEDLVYPYFSQWSANNNHGKFLISLEICNRLFKCNSSVFGRFINLMVIIDRYEDVTRVIRIKALETIWHERNAAHQNQMAKNVGVWAFTMVVYNVGDFVNSSFQLRLMPLLFDVMK